MIEDAYQISSISQQPPQKTPNAEQQLRNILKSNKQHYFNSHCRSLLSLIEDQMFQQAQSVANILNQDHSRLIDGTSYQEIKQSPSLSLQLQKIRQNAPPYQNLTVNKKKKFLKELANKYNSSLILRKQMRDEDACIDACEQTLQISQISISTERKLRKKIWKSNFRSPKSKYEDSSKEPEEFESREPQFKKLKRVCFASQSSKKYFCKELPPSNVLQERMYLFPTIP